jgi:hypothetical protein
MSNKNLVQRRAGNVVIYLCHTQCLTLFPNSLGVNLQVPLIHKAELALCLAYGFTRTKPTIRSAMFAAVVRLKQMVLIGKGVICIPPNQRKFIGIYTGSRLKPGIYSLPKETAIEWGYLVSKVYQFGFPDEVNRRKI